MPFVKSNWSCEAPLEKDGAFDFGQAYTVQSLVLHRAEQTRPCFLHGTSSYFFRPTPKPQSLTPHPQTPHVQCPRRWSVWSSPSP